MAEEAERVDSLREKEKFINLKKEEKRIKKVLFICEKCKKEKIITIENFLNKADLVCGNCHTQEKRALKKDEIQAKIKATCLERYGVISNFVTLNKERKEKSELIGAADPKIREKMTQTNKERYGVDSCSPFARKEVQEKAKSTLIEKYGVDHNFKIESFKENRAKKRIEQNQKYRNSDEYVKFFIGRYIIPRNLKVDSTYLKENELYYQLECEKCGEKFEWSILDRIQGREQYPYCKRCFHSGTSLEEEDLYNFVKSIYGGPIIRNDREVLNGKEIDIYLPEKKFGIEYNGLYWHAGNSSRHREKWELAQKAEVDLMQIWSCEWETKRPILESIIKNRLGLAKPVYARKCELKEVPVKDARVFANENHMQGFYAGIYVGLYFEGELIDMSIFCKERFGGKYEWELTRHVIKHGYRVIGGLSREISYFRKTGHRGDMVDYCDMRLFNGKGHWGFEEVGITPPDMQYTDFVRIIPRGKYQKKNMSKIPGFKFDPTKTQLENLHENGMDFIYGVGHKIFVHRDALE